MALPFGLDLVFHPRTHDDDGSSHTPPLRAEHDATPAATDDTLIARLRAGDEFALETLFTTHYNRLCTYAARVLGTPDLAEEAVLDVMTSVWERRATLTVQGTLRGYLTGAVRLRAANIARACRVTHGWNDRIAHENIPPGLATTDLAPDTETLTHELEQTITTAVHTLPPRCRAAFQLAWYGGLTYAEVAEQLGVSVKAVEAHMARAYRTLREALTPLR